jgi:type I restriction enzyme S subunit
MTSTALSMKHFRILNWSEIEKWMPNASLLLYPNMPKKWRLMQVRNLVSQFNEKHPAEANKTYKLAGVRWYGKGIFHRETVKGKDISSKYLHPLITNSFIYNRLFAWKESFAIVPETFSGYYVSSEFPQFSINKQEIIPEYLFLVFLTNKVIRAVNSASVGSSAVSRNRFRETDFLNFHVPVPPLSVQQSIFEHWHKAQVAVDVTEERIYQLEQKIAGRFISDLGLTLPKPIENLKVFDVHWNEFERWSVSYNQTRLSIINLAPGKYQVVDLGSLLEMVQYGTSEKAHNDKIGTPVIRMNNIIEGELNLSNLKYILLPEKNENALLLKKGDILFNRTNSKDLVGKCAVFHESGNYVFASYLIRVRADKARAIPDYLSFVINSPIGRRQINALSRQIIGQANINSQELRSLQIPLPPLEIQHKIMDWVKERKAEIISERNSSELLRQKTKIEIEEMIMCIRPVEGV